MNRSNHLDEEEGQDRKFNDAQQGDGEQCKHNVWLKTFPVW